MGLIHTHYRNQAPNLQAIRFQLVKIKIDIWCNKYKLGLSIEKVEKFNSKIAAQLTLLLQSPGANR